MAITVRHLNPLLTGNSRLNLLGLWVSFGYRDRGVGSGLLELACDHARARGAKSLCVSATPSEHTVHFYLSRGRRLADSIDPSLYEAEPDDIHLELPLRPRLTSRPDGTRWPPTLP